VICVPELPDSKTTSSDCVHWLNPIEANLDANIQLLEYQYTVDEKSDSIWQILVQRGEELLQALLTEGKDLGVRG
jgi:hypothetical protein